MRRVVPRPRTLTGPLCRMLLPGLHRGLLLGLLVGLVLSALAVGPASGASTTLTPADTVVEETVVEYYYGEDCPVCAVAGPALDRLAAEHPQVRLERHEVWEDAAGRELLQERAAAYNVDATGVPVILVGERAWIGYRDGVTDVEIERVLLSCQEQACPDPATVDLPDGRSGLAAVDETCAEAGSLECAPDEARTIDIPLLGVVDLADRSLLVSTVLIALVDGVNPCSLWVLTVLIALTLNSGSRRRTLVVGVTFITVTAAIYALFIAGLFTVLTVVSFAPWLRALVALVALLFAVVSIKDYFWFRRGLSFTIADQDKPGIYRGMRAILAQGNNLPAVVGATAVLAAGVSLVEFGCTAGFPVLWTNLLTSQGVGAGTFVLLLLVYMAIYQLDEFLIFGTAVVTLRASRLQETQGRVLKLVGGMLMLALALVMLVRPELMSGVGSSLAVFAAAVGTAGLVLLVHRVLLPRLHRGSTP